MIVNEIQAKSVLSKSKVYDYVVNPYVGCEHACCYCYACFMRRFTGHREPWGSFVDVKVNAPDLLRKEVVKKKPGKVWMSGVCDPYQPVESRYELTRKCVQILAENERPVVIQTRSPLVVRDIDVFPRRPNFHVGLSITTANDRVRQAFEPNAPPIDARLKALAQLHNNGITTYAMIAPLLPDAEKLIELLHDTVDYVIVDKMNYHCASGVYAKHGWNRMKTDNYFVSTAKRIEQQCAKYDIDCQIVF